MTTSTAFAELLTDLSLIDSAIEPGDDPPLALHDRIVHALECIIDDARDAMLDDPDGYYYSFTPAQFIAIRDEFVNEVRGHGL